MIQLHDISKGFGPQLLFEGLSWTIKPGQRIGLVGPNGAGKSTLVRLIVGEEPSDGGEISIPKGTRIGYLPQEVALLAGRSVREEARRGLSTVLALGEEMRATELALESASEDALDGLMARYGDQQARFEALGGFTIESRVEEVLGGLGFHHSDFDRDCGELSGGWQMRVVLCRLLLEQPDVLFLDEPTNHLDLDSLVWLENMLNAFKGSLVFISHDRWFLNRLSSHIAELSSRGLRVYTGNFDKYIAQAAEDRALLQRQHKNQQRRIAELERFISRFRAKATKARQVQSRVKALEKMERVTLEQSERTIQFQITEAPKSGRVVMTLENVAKRYGSNTVYEHLAVEMTRGQRIALVGANGAGKSTLLKMMAGQVEPDEGRRELGFQARLYYFAQHQVEALRFDQTVLAEAMDGAETTSITRIRATLGAFLFDEDDVSKRVEVLSGGEKNRLALVKMLLAPANVLLLDEPTNHLDMASRAVLEEALQTYRGTVVIISHDRHFIDTVCNEVWEIGDGRVTPFLGNYSEYKVRVGRGDRPEPLPLYSPPRPAAVKPKPAPKPKAPKPKVAKAESAPPKIDWGGSNDGVVRRRRSKEEKREEALARQQRKASSRGLRKQVEAAEAEVQRIETRIEEIESEQSEPSHYGDPERVRALAKESADLRAALTAAYARWESAAGALEAAEG